ncbi:SIR2 family NAD-dependent protein deacylase [Vulgatibacter sp.]|uniref:SIR2 family NAD-dependent protein deacylase n=1 Tax=Vulgatibacter sp. TaxID=1971226 RepID=UPI00356648ED
MNNTTARAAERIRGARALVFTAGAGMGVDSGLPDFRGPEGFWRAYPPFRALGLHFEDLANPVWFERDPALAWGFYGHRLGLYRSTTPHRGFALLRAWAARAPAGAFVFTTNIDGHFQRAGFADERVIEYHGSLGWLQCTKGCGAGIFSAAGVEVRVDPATFRAMGALPRCPGCGALARPNVLMFGDWSWEQERTAAQSERLERWLAATDPAQVVVIECGAGTAVPSARRFGERLQAQGATLVRINPREAAGPEGTLSIETGAKAALEALDGAI